MLRWLFITRKDSRQRLPYFLAHPACGIPWFNYLLRVKVPEKSARKFLGGRHQSPPLIIYRHVDYLVITCTHDANVFSSLFLNYHDLALSSLPKRNRDEDNCPWEMYPREAEERKSKVEAHERKGRKAEAAFADFRRRRRTSQSAARNVHGGRQWRAIAYISLASRCSRLLITQGSGLGTRVINGSGPRLGYRGTKLRANLPQPYINPDFLSLLSQRSPSLLPAPPSPCRIPTARYNEKACVLSCPDYSSPSLAPNKIVY